MVIGIKIKEPGTRHESQKMYIDGKLVVEADCICCTGPDYESRLKQHFFPTKIIEFIRTAYQAGLKHKGLAIRIDRAED